MTGRASAELICKHPVIRRPNFGVNEPYKGYCGNVIRPDLYIDHDGLLRFKVPAYWYVNIGSDPANTEVRCPQHNPEVLPQCRMPIGGRITPWHELMPLRSAILYARRCHINIELESS